MRDKMKEEMRNNVLVIDQMRVITTYIGKVHEHSNTVVIT